MFQNTFRKLYSCFVVVLRSFPQSFASGAPVVGVCTVVTKYAQRTIFIVPGVKNDLNTRIRRRFWRMLRLDLKIIRFMEI